MTFKSHAQFLMRLFLKLLLIEHNYLLAQVRTCNHKVEKFEKSKQNAVFKVSQQV